MIVNDKFKFEPSDPKEPKRGSYAFQTDLLVTNIESLPLVVIEIKYGGFTTHDVLTYSIKAHISKAKISEYKHLFIFLLQIFYLFYQVVLLC